MALRLLEVVIDEQFAEAVELLFETSDVKEFWQTCGCTTTVIFKAIIRTEKTELYFHSHG